MIKRIISKYGKSLFGFKFWMGIFCIFLLFQLDAEMPFFYDDYRWKVTEETSDFKIILSGCIFYGMYIYMICIPSTIGFGTQFCVEWKAGVVPQMVKKLGLKKYSTIYIFLATISGGSIAMFGFVLYALYMNYHVLLHNPNAAQPHLQKLLYSFTLQDTKGIQYVIIMSLLVFLVGTLSAITALCLSTITENIYLVMVSPYLIYRVYVEVCKLMEVPDKFRMDYYLFGRQDIGESFGEFIIILGVILIMAVSVGIFIFRNGVRRKLAYEKY